LKTIFLSFFLFQYGFLIIGIILKDLIGIEDGNPNTVESADGNLNLVNIRKYRLLAEVLASVKKCRYGGWQEIEILSLPAIEQYLSSHLVEISSDELNVQSHRIEPPTRLV
jgi:hypothetical protein